MAKQNGAHEAVLESLTTALLILMEKKPLKKINITELCIKAGVGRVSYYRNYTSVEDILIAYFTALTDEWWLCFTRKTPDEMMKSFWSELLSLYKKNEKPIKLIYENNASFILKQHIFSCCKPIDDSERAAYENAALAGAIFGLIDEWIRRGMQSFPSDFSLRHMISPMTFGSVDTL